MMGQLQGYKHQYEGATHGAKDFGEKLSPEVARDLDKAEAASAAKAQAGQANPAAPAGGGAAPQGGGNRTVTRQGTIKSGPNTGKRVIEYSDGTRSIQ
jgi:hypothetical protein